MPENILKSCSDFLWPRKCELCERPSDRDGRFLCSSCMMRLKVEEQSGCCRVCARPVAGYSGEYLCEQCAGDPPAYDRLAVPLGFQGHTAVMIKNFKFNRHIYLKDDFTDWLEGAVRVRFDPDAIDVILPMPTTVFHRWDRGYNQCAYLAEELSRRLSRRYDSSLIARQGRPKRQSELPGCERRANVMNTFRVLKPEFIRGRTLLLVDDIITSGETMSACARELKAAGAYKVWCAALARSGGE